MGRYTSSRRRRVNYFSRKGEVSIREVVRLRIVSEGLWGAYSNNNVKPKVRHIFLLKLHSNYNMLFLISIIYKEIK